MRDIRFDALRTIGLLAIVLAHVSPPGPLFQLRNFDVPLMVLVSGSVFASSSGSGKNYLNYFFSRIYRLLLPTWLFLSFYFLFWYIFANIAGSAFPYAPLQIEQSYNLVGGIGYVWIIRVFILTALVSPFFLLLYRRAGSKKFLLALLLIYAFYELIFYLYNYAGLLSNLKFKEVIFDYFLFFALPYGCVAGLGIYLKKAPRRALLYLMSGIAALTLISFIYLSNSHQDTATQAYKYPPHMYYFSYALAVSLLLYILAPSKAFIRIFGRPVMKFIAASSLWIYLWHILFLSLWHYFAESFYKPLQNFAVEYVVVFALALFVTWTQKKIIGYVCASPALPSGVKTFLTLAFLK